MKDNKQSRLERNLFTTIIAIAVISVAFSLALSRNKKAVLADTASELIIGDNEVDLNGDDPVILAFVPEETGYYKFWARNYEMSIAAELWDAEQYPDGECICRDIATYGDNFAILAELTAGKTYVLVCWNTFTGPYDQEFAGVDNFHFDYRTTVRVVSYNENTNPNSCGKNATWSFDSESGVLTISGTGAMFDAEDYFDTRNPWYGLAVKSVVIENGITSIGNNAFPGLGITSVVIPESVTDIAPFAFAGCNFLTSVTIPGSVNKIEMYAFYRCGGLENVTIEEGVKEIAPKAFSYTGLTSVTTPKSIELISFAAFEKCEALENVTIRGGVIEPHAFPGCYGIKTASFGEGVGFIGAEAFSNCTLLESVTFEEGIKHIGSLAFYKCEKLESITIPGSVISIGKYDFVDCLGPQMLSNYTGGNVFGGCTSLSDVYCYANPDKLEWYNEWESFCCHVFPEYENTYKTKFSSSGMEFVGDLSNKIDMGLGETLYGYSLSLGSSIGVNCYVDLDPETLSDDAYMLFTVPSGSKTTTQKIYVKDVVNANKQMAVDGTTYYIFECMVSAKDVASTISAQLIDGEREGLVYKYSVKTYAEYLIEHQEDPQYSEAARLARAMLVYGTWAQKYFKVNLNTIDDSLLDETELSDVSITPPQTVFDLPDVVICEHSSLSLKAETTLSLYFSSEEKLSFSCEGKQVDTEIVNGYQVARIRGIKAGELGNSFRLNVSCERGEGYVVYSPMNYCYGILNGSFGDDVTNTIRAMCKYYEAAIQYIESVETANG